MKTEAQIREKIAEHERHINAILEIDRDEWTDFFVLRIELYLMGRTALQWVLSEESSIEIDTYEKQAKWECTRFDSTKIF